MNLWYLRKYGGDRQIEVAGSLNFVARRNESGPWTSFQIGPDTEVRLKGAGNWHPLKSGVGQGNWLCTGRGKFVIDAYDGNTGTIISSIRYFVSDIPQPVSLPIPLNGGDLIIRTEKNNGHDVFLWIMQMTKHDHIYQRAIGYGIEIGPGPSPRIHPSDQTDVTYLERYSVDEYMKINKGYEQRAPHYRDHFEKYRIGNASHIPEDIGDLDFIFSAHMIEHLPNPLGHLKLWYGRLNPGGEVLGIIPNIHGCSDFMRHEPTRMKEWKELFTIGDVDHAQEWQYLRYEKQHKKTAKQMLEEDFRPHFSFFTKENLEAFLDLCCDHIGFREYGINAAVNNVSMDFWLKK